MSLPDRNSALHIAAKNNRLDEVRCLLKLAETDCDILDRYGETPLIASLRHRCSDELVSLLIDYGCNVNLPTGSGVTPLHLAVQRRNPLIVSKLIQKGADVNAKSKRHDCTPLHDAVIQGRLSSVQEILRLKEDSCNLALLCYSLKKNCTNKIVSLLIDYSQTANMRDPYLIQAFFLSLRRRDTFIAEKLLLSGVNVDEKNELGLSPLHKAVQSQITETVCMLLYYNASVNERDDLERNPFEMAVMRNDCIIARHLIDYVDDFNYVGFEDFTALHMALRYCPALAVEIIEKGGDVNVPWHGTHTIMLSLWWFESSEVFEAIWPKIDFRVFSALHRLTDFFETFVSLCKFPDDEFLKCLFMILDSSYVEEFFGGTTFHYKEWFLLYILKRYLPLKDRLDIIAILLSYGLEIFFNDICFLHETYGFDECLEMIFSCGCCIYRNNVGNVPKSLITSKICYNICDIDPKKMIDQNFETKILLKYYKKFYKLRSDNTATSQVESLLQLSRDVVRNEIYRSQTTNSSFKVYQAFSQLPVPLKIRDILILKRAIY